MEILIIKEDVCLKSLDYFCFLYAPKKKYFVDVYIPVPKSLDYPHLRRGVARGDYRNSHWRKLNPERKAVLQPGEFA